MVFWPWLIEHWFTLLDGIGIVGSLLFAGSASLSENKTRRISNDLEITKSHREIWSHFLDKPELHRVLNPFVNLGAVPTTTEERIFVNFVILHLNSVFHAIKDKLVMNPEGLRQDIREFFSLPIPHDVWVLMKKLHNQDFVEFVECCLQKESTLSD